MSIGGIRTALVIPTKVANGCRRLNVRPQRIHLAALPAFVKTLGSTIATQTCSPTCIGKKYICVLVLRSCRGVKSRCSCLWCTVNLNYERDDHQWLPLASRIDVIYGDMIEPSTALASSATMTSPLSTILSPITPSKRISSAMTTARSASTYTVSRYFALWWVSNSGEEEADYKYVIFDKSRFIVTFDFPRQLLLIFSTGCNACSDWFFTGMPSVGTTQQVCNISNDDKSFLWCSGTVWFVYVVPESSSDPSCGIAFNYNGQMYELWWPQYSNPRASSPFWAHAQMEEGIQ